MGGRGNKMVEKIAYIFPGQGAQYAGMGKDLYENSPAAKRIFDTADGLLGFRLSKLCFEGPVEELTLTKNCQLAVLTTSIAALRTLEEEGKTVEPVFAAGLSLGEYSALVAAGAISFEDSLLLVRDRANLMTRSAEKNPGTMLAVIGLDKEIVDVLVKDAGVEIANRNCPGQIVVTGKKEGINKFAKLADEEGAKRVIELVVSGAFHSTLMKEASARLEERLKGAEFRLPRVETLSNVTARPFASVEDIRKNLALQVSSSVLWEDSVRYMVARGVNNFLEIGPGRVLKGLLRKISPSLKVLNIAGINDVSNFASV